MSTETHTNFCALGAPMGEYLFYDSTKKTLNSERERPRDIDLRVYSAT